MQNVYDPEEKSILDKLSEERKQGIKDGTIPEWFVTPSYQVFKAKYVWENQTPRDTYQRIAKCAAKHMKKHDPDTDWESKFFEIMWKGWFSPSTPILANMGTNRGCPIACSGGYIGDSVESFYSAQTEAALLSKNGFGTSGYLGDIRPRGSKISGGGHASGVVPVFKDFMQMSRDISQGGVRRGSWAGYLEMEHGDFYELCDLLGSEPDDMNVGWIVTDKFIELLEQGDTDAMTRFSRALKVKAITGKGYFFFRDKVNRLSPPMYKDRGFEVKASNLCIEINNLCDIDHTFTCVLGSMNISKFDEWKDTNAVFISTVFLDCVAQEFIEIGSKIKGLEKAVRFTKKSRSLGLGVLGFHTYLQENMIPFGSFEASLVNGEVFEHLHKESLRASEWMTTIFDAPEWCAGYGVHNTHRMAIAPTSSTSLIMGGISRGIEPIVENVYNEPSAAGEISRINPTLLKILKERGIYNKKTLKSIIDNNGSVQHMEELSELEKNVFKTAFEIDMRDVLRLASTRQKYIDQGQSLNLFFNADEDEEYIAKIHQIAFRDPNIKQLYYMRSKAGVQAAKETCEGCSG